MLAGIFFWCCLHSFSVFDDSFSEMFLDRVSLTNLCSRSAPAASTQRAVRDAATTSSGRGSLPGAKPRWPACPGWPNVSPAPGHITRSASPGAAGCGPALHQSSREEKEKGDLSGPVEEKGPKETGRRRQDRQHVNVPDPRPSSPEWTPRPLQAGSGCRRPRSVLTSLAEKYLAFPFISL